MKILERFSLTTKLLVGFAYLGLVCLLLAWQSLASQQIMSEQIRQVYDRELMGLSHLKEARINFVLVGRSFRQMLLTTTPEDRELARQQMEAADQRLNRELLEARQQIGSSADLDRFLQLYADYRQFIARLLAKPPAEVGAMLASTESRRARDEAEAMVSALCRAKEQEAGETARRAADIYAASRRRTLALLALVLLALPVTLMISASILGPTERLRQAVEQLAEGRLDQHIPYTRLQHTVGKMARSLGVLQEGARRTEEQRWVKDHASALLSRLHKSATLEELGRELLSGLGPLLQLGGGALYHYDEEEHRLQPIGGYGQAEMASVGLDEGLLGQCARDKAPINLNSAPAGYLRVRSGLGEADPSCLALRPLLHQGKLRGVLELAALHPWSQRQTDLLESLLGETALCLELLEERRDVKRLLGDAQEQARRLEAQAAQLEEQTVELDAQQAELKQTEEWYHGIIESAPDGILVVDQQGGIVLANRRAAAIFGYDELEGVSIERLVPASIRPGHPALRARFLQEGQTRQMGAGKPLVGIRQDGTEVKVAVALSRLPGRQGEDWACACVREA